MVTEVGVVAGERPSLFGWLMLSSLEMFELEEEEQDSADARAAIDAPAADSLRENTLRENGMDIRSDSTRRLEPDKFKEMQKWMCIRLQKFMCHRTIQSFNN